MNYIKALFFILILLTNTAANAQQPDMQTLMDAVQCSSKCVDQQTECFVKLEPSCKQANDKSACYEECNATYTTCLGGCNQPLLDGSSDSAAQ